MSQNINLRDGEIAIVFENFSIIMNVNTAFEVLRKCNTAGAGCSCHKDKEDENEFESLFNKDNLFDKFNEFNHTKVEQQVMDVGVEYTKKPEPVQVDPFADVTEVKSASTNKEKIPVLAFAFDSERAAEKNDLRAGVGKCIKRFDSMSAADCFYYVSPGTTSAVVNTWLPYIHYTGVMNPRCGDEKNYRFSSKHNGKILRWYLTTHPYWNNSKVIKKVVLFRADAVPQFILDRYANKK